MPAMPLATAAATTTRGALSPRSATYGKLKKKSLVAQLQKRDADLRDQEDLIRRLQQKLEYYESKELIVASSSWASSSDASSSYRPRGGSGTTGSLNNSEDDAGAEYRRSLALDLGTMALVDPVAGLGDEAEIILQRLCVEYTEEGGTGREKVTA